MDCYSFEGEELKLLKEHPLELRGTCLDEYLRWSGAFGWEREIEEGDACVVQFA